MKKLTALALLLTMALALLPAPALAVHVDAPERLAIGKSSGTYVHFSFAVDEQGGLWSWGENTYGRTGQTRNVPQSGAGLEEQFRWMPTKILDDVVSVSAGRDFAAAVKKDGTLWMWGNSDYGQLANCRVNRVYEGGFGNSYHAQWQDEPTCVMRDVAAVDCAEYSVAVIKTDGSLWVWGRDRYDLLGTGKKGSDKSSGYSSYRSTPVKILDDVAAVSLGTSSSAAVKTDGTLWTWGQGYGGQLMDGKLDSASNKPVQVGEGWKDVACGPTCAGIKEDGSLWDWGSVATGCVAGDLTAGDRTYKGKSETFRYQCEPLKIMDDVAAVRCAHQGTGGAMMAVKEDGTLWGWGYNNIDLDGRGDVTGILGLPGSSTRCVEPTKVLDGVAEVSVWEYGLAIKEDGTLWGWGGDNPLNITYDPATGAVGEYVNGDKAAWQTPVQVPHVFPQVEPTSEPEPAPEAEPLVIVSTGVDPEALGVALEAAQPVDVAGKKVELQAYALADGKGGRTNYVKVRDVAALLDGTAGQFDVAWDGAVDLVTGTRYASRNGQENKTPYTGDRSYEKAVAPTRVNGAAVSLQAFILRDDLGNGSTYYKLRDLGQALGFNVGWSADKGIFIQPDRPYDAAD